jgi:hypothetical protein
LVLVDDGEEDDDDDDDDDDEDDDDEVVSGLSIVKLSRKLCVVDVDDNVKSFVLLC